MTELRRPITHRFGACEIRLWPETEYAETVYPDDTRCGATRECEVGNERYATHLGYEGDCWTAMVEHEIGHTLISEALGHPHSPTLWAVAHDYGPGSPPYEEILTEEAIVLAVQRYSRRGDVLPILSLPHVEPHYRAWADEIRSLTERLLGAEEKHAA